MGRLQAVWSSPAWNGTQYAYADELGDLKDGFWVTQKLEFTKYSDARYWIPPSAIRYIKKAGYD